MNEREEEFLNKVSDAVAGIRQSIPKVYLSDEVPVMLEWVARLEACVTAVESGELLLEELAEMLKVSALSTKDHPVVAN
jgi:hypothetical protein